MNKKKLARKMLTKKERENHTPIFQSVAWEERRKGQINKMFKPKKIK